ncbi:lipase [Asanoa ishikariensis]|uniref:Lipase (Class 2) n=1 Tax=Asanoa ishikariensis TaxID=137265 RepID=A0A1H3L3N5_9ACTN|nr:alpha/beta fold hydrolase [Asanoa ishikariensis]GIF69524.1 lipase [Asanoa ishikariensis]SDY58970.1 Lipase (class 2) [Asanoa ishikariensis]
MRRLLSVVAAIALVLTATPAVASGSKPRPVIFVHGSAGSASQFESQTRRLTSNGFPIEIIEAHEYDSPNVATILPAIFAGLDERVERLRARTGQDQVDIVAHSLGTFVMQSYLASSPARAQRVAHYVNLDGRTATAPPGGVPTLAIWGEGDQTRAITGATNVYLPNQSHTQTVSSEESFREMFRFFSGRSPHTGRIVPTRHAEISGRAVLFPSNAGVTDATLEVYRVSPLSGRRLSHRPVKTAALTGDGTFGPIKLDSTARYELAVVRPGAATHHFYFQPFLRDSAFVRLLTSRPGEGLGALVETGARHTALTIQRQQEWWGDQGAAGDHLWVNGRDILNAANAPRVKRVIGIFAFDAGSDRRTDLTAPLPAFFAQTFITGMDVYVPARPRGLVSITVGQRGGGYESVNVPNWPSSDHRITVNVNDY